MSITTKRLAASIAISLTLATNSFAAEPLKIGLVLPMSGPFSSYGKQIERGVQLYLQENGDNFAGRKVQIILKDDTGAAPEVTRRVAQELMVGDKVDILAGFATTPGAMATAQLSANAKMPMVIMNAGTSSLTEKSPYITRTSAAVAQYTAPLGPWSVDNGMKRAFTLVADFGPGHDAERYFTESYNAAGGQVIGSVRVPVQNSDFAPYLQRIKDAKPDVVFLFLPAGEAVTAFLKGFSDRGLAQENIRIVATGDLTNEDTIDALGNAALGVVTAHHYAETHNSPENKAYTAAYYKSYNNARPNFMSVGGYDGMRLIHEVLKKTKGDASGDAFINAVKGLTFVSPRGPIEIDKDTRDINQTIYIRRVEQKDGRLINAEIDDSLKNYKDPGKQ
ncbi:ABC transporter substrate-binding protein [Pusillimonas sp. NJUB218]|uniref:ABC transporter substrate-binding protein n=1 Tax=Pusillimonas sp. NJUB218 TaxID=2023230 RepID=UPI000F4C2242|nr:ABC transporter substrate-binding protein [Pusillimonas sp. NJUB218]ROT46476.1 ABC transporter substrate-binding protein [Pusillimonas sp. NJUB218]